MLGSGRNVSASLDRTEISNWSETKFRSGKKVEDSNWSCCVQRLETQLVLVLVVTKIVFLIVARAVPVTEEADGEGLSLLPRYRGRLPRSTSILYV